MAKSLIFNYTFTPSADTIVVDGRVSLKRLLLVSNTTKNIIMYSFADTTKKILSTSYDASTDETTFVLQYDCSAMSVTDTLQIFIEQDATKFEPSDTYQDPVSKFRVSQPNTLIDTDFEYGLQATKWETVERLNEVPAFHSIQNDTPLSGIISITTVGTRIVTVTCSSAHGLVTGTPIDVRGIDSATAEGTFVVKRTTDYAFSYEAKAVQPGTQVTPSNLLTPYVNITGGRFYVNAQVKLDNTAATTAGPMTTDAGAPASLTLRTEEQHGFATNSQFYLVNSLSNNKVNFNPVTISNSSGEVDDRQTLFGTGAVFTATMATTQVTISAMTSGVITIGMLVRGSGVVEGTVITAYVSGTFGGVGVYTISKTNTVGAGVTMTGTTFSTGYFLPAEPFHQGTIRRDITQAGINISTHVLTVTAHGLAQGDRIAYVGTSSGGSAPQINANVSANFAFGAGPLPQYSTTNGRFLFVGNITTDTFKLYPSPKDAYAGTNPIQFNGIGSGTHTFTFFKRGTDAISSFSSISSVSGSPNYTVQLTAGNTNYALGILPKQQITISGADVSSLNGVFSVLSTNYSPTGTSFVMAGPTDAAGANINAGSTATYTIVASGGNGSTSFNRWNYISTLGIRAQVHNDHPNHTRVAYHDWKAKTAKYFTFQEVPTGSDRIYIKNHGLETGEPVVFGFNGNTWTGGTNTPINNAIYFVSRINADEIELFTNENATGTGPFSTATANLKINFSAVTTLAGGVFSLQPGMTIANFTSQTVGAGGQARDRAICLFSNVPTWVREGTAIILRAGSGSTLPTPVTNTPDTITSYQKYYIRNVFTQNSATEFSLSITPTGPILDLTGATTAGSAGTTTAGGGRFFVTAIDENPFSNSFYIENHGGFATNRRVGGTVVTGLTTSYTGQGVYPATPDYPGPMFDKITDATGQNWPRVRTFLSQKSSAELIQGLTLNAQYYMVPVNNNVFKLQAYSTTVLPSGNPTMQITGIVPGTAAGEVAFSSPFVQNQYANRIVVPVQDQLFVDNAVVRYENNGGTDIGSGTVGFPGLVNNKSYIVKNVINDIAWSVSGLLSAATADATSLTITTAVGLSIGDTIKVGNEFIYVSNIVSQTLTVIRGYRGSTAVDIEEATAVEKLYGSFQLFDTLQGQQRVFATGAADTTGDFFTLTNHNLKTGETLAIAATSGGAIANFGSIAISLVGAQVYYALVYNNNEFALAFTPALAYAQYPLDITTAGTAWTFVHYYSSIPLTGLASSTVGDHTLEDVSSTGTLDGGYQASGVTSTSITLATGTTVPVRSFNFEPADYLNMLTGEFMIPNHGFMTGTAVTYTKNSLVYAIGEGAVADVPTSGYTTLANNTVYYVIRTGIDSFQLASTKANALSGIALRRFGTLGSVGSHSFSTAIVYGESLAQGLATIVARDLVVNGSSNAVVIAASDRIVFTSHGLVTGDRVTYRVWAGGRVINGLVDGRQYFVNNSANATTTRGGALTGQTANQFSLHNSWVGSYTNTDLVDMSGVGTGTVHQFKVSNPTLVGTTYKGEWNAADTYLYGDVVLYNSMYWMSLVNANTNFAPVALTTGLDNLSWMRCPTLQNYSTRFLVSYRGGDTIKLSNQIVRRTLIVDGSSASRVIVADNRINFVSVHNLKTGDAVRYNISAPGSKHQGSTPATGDYSAFVGTTGIPQTPIGGLVANRIYYVNVQGTSDITLHNTLAEAIEGGSGDTGNFATAINLTAVGTGTIHRFELLENVTYSMNILSVTNDKEMIVADPYPAKSIVFNPQGSFITVTGLTTDTVDIPENEIYIANHGLDTGVKIYYSVGPAGSGTAIGGLTDGTAYYIVKSDEDSFALATTIYNAYLNIRVDITSTGTGFQHYFIAATAAGSSYLRYDNAGAFTTNVPSGTLYYANQIGGNLRDGVLTGLPIIQETQVFVRPDCINVHRPFDGGVEINASISPLVSITRQTRRYFRYQSGKGLQFSTGINFSPSIDVARITHDGTTYATVKTRRPHRLTTNSKVIIENVESKDEYTAVKCERDVGYFLDGVGYDITLGTNYNAVFLGLAETNSLDLSASVLTAITNTKLLVAGLPNVSASVTATARSNAYFTELLDITTNGRTAADPITYTNPGTATVSQIAAKDRLASNKAFIAAEINAWVAGTYPNATHDVAKCTRDVGYAVQALAYDILYGGNSATVAQAKFFFYFDSSGVSGIYAQDKSQTVAAYNRLQAIISDIVEGIDITGGFGNPSGKSTGNALTQDKTGTNASAGDGAILEGLVQITESVIAANSRDEAIEGLPTTVYPSVTWALDELETARTAIIAAKDSIIQNVVRGAPYTQPANGGEYFIVNDIIDDFTFRYVTNGVPINLAPSGFPNLFVHSWSDAVVRAGIFDDQNGLFYEYDGKHLNAVRRSSTAQLGGTATATFGTRKLIGDNTNWTKQLRAGESIVVRGMSLKITAVISDTEVHFTPAYRGATRSDIVVTLTQDLKIPTYLWNKDTVDGHGPTGFNLNIHRMQMAYIDYSWYGAGKVRYGFKGPDGKVFYGHELIHNNKETEAYMRSGNLPARYQIQNGSNPTFAPSLYHWGASMIMDGGFEDDKAYLFTVASGSAGNDTISIPQTLAGTPVPILSIRLAPSVDSSLVGALGDRDIVNRMQIALNQVGIVVANATSKPASVRLVLNGALAQQAYFANYGSPSLTQIIKHTGQASDSIVGGTTVYEFRALATATGNQIAQDLSELVEIGNCLLGGDYVYPNGPDIITLCVVPSDTAAVTSVTARFTWKESQA